MRNFMSGKRRTDEYWEAVKSLEKVLKNDRLDAAMRASAEALAEPIQTGILSQGYKESSTACINRLIKGGGGCSHDRPDVDWERCPHQPPFRDHVSLLLKDGKPVAYVMHMYDDLPWERIKELTEFCVKYNLKFSIKAASWHFPNRTICVWIERAGSSTPEPFVNISRK